MVLYHETIDANLQLQSDQMPVKDTPEFRLRVLQGFQGALWSAKVTFRENDYQQILELECRHLEAFLPFGTKCPDLSSHFLKLPRCSIGGGCPIAPLRDLAVDVDLGNLSVHNIDAFSVRALIAFNEVQLPDEESLQQDPKSTSAMRVKRSVDCCLSGSSDGPFRSKIRAAGPASAVNWILRARPGEARQVVIMQTDVENEWSVLWHVEICQDALPAVKAYYTFLSQAQQESAALKFESEMTPAKRVRVLRDNMPTPSKSNVAWQDS